MQSNKTKVILNAIQECFLLLSYYNVISFKVEAGKSSLLKYFELLSSFQREDYYKVWRVILPSIQKINFYMSHTDFQSLFHNFIKKLVSEIYKHVGWDAKPQENPLKSLLRSALIDTMGKMRHGQVISEALKRYQLHKNGTRLIPNDLKATVMGIVGGNCDEKSYEGFFQVDFISDLQVN